MFEFATAPIEPERLKTSLADATAGGYAAFEGWVRDHNDGQRVTRLEYEAYEALALREGARIVAEALARFGVHRARCVHRLGSLAVGELAVWVGVASAHRSEAFAACRYIIDEVKHRVPIWKKEHYAGGDSGWVNCERCAAPSDAATLPAAAPGIGHHHAHAGGRRAAPRFDYSRQVTLAEVGVTGQARLARARVLVTGAGGLGCPVLLYLAGAGVGTLGIVDADVVEASNLHRQPLYTLADVGRAKAVVAAERLRAFNPDIEVRVHAERFAAGNGATLLADYDVVVDCSDNFATKFLVNDAAVLAGKPAVLASVYQYEGQLQVVRPDAGGSCLRCLWPEATRDGLVGNCAESGVLGPVPGLFGNLQALETLKLLLDLPGQLRDEVLVLDLLGASLHRLRARRSADCADGPCRRITAPTPAPADLEVALPPAEAVRAGYTLVDIREPAEIAAHPLPGPGCLQIPMPTLLAEPGQLPPGPRYLLVCARGQRSRATALRLRAAGIAAHSLQGGVATLA